MKSWGSLAPPPKKKEITSQAVGFHLLAENGPLLVASSRLPSSYDAVDEFAAGSVATSLFPLLTRSSFVH